MTAPQNPSVYDDIAALQPDLYRIALLQLGDVAVAEDVTQDALVSAIEGIDRFQGRSSLRTWLISILRYKVIDAFRSGRRIAAPIDPNELTKELDLGTFQRLFDETGCWATPKDIWTDPETHVERLEFFKILEACMTKLPLNSARVFLMREWLELDSDEVCSITGFSSGNLRVLLYRARMQLRLCLDKNWDRDA